MRVCTLAYSVQRSVSVYCTSPNMNLVPHSLFALTELLSGHYFDWSVLHNPSCSNLVVFFCF